MSVNVLIRTMFIIWAIAIAVFSIIPYQNNDGIANNKLVSSSRAEMHFIAYFIAALLCYYGFIRNGISFILLSAFSVFLFGVVLEIVQLYLPYRTFNIRDIVANTSGIILFILLWAIYTHFLKRKQSADNTDLHRYKRSEDL